MSRVPEDISKAPTLKREGMSETGGAEGGVGMSEADWDGVLQRLRLAQATLVHRSRADGRHRVYRNGERVFKIYSGVGLFRRDREQGYLRKEYDLVRQCADIPEVPRAVDYRRCGGIEVGVYEAIDASPLRIGPLTTPDLVVVWGRLLMALLRLSWRGIVHNDLYAKNLLITADRRCYVIDFDCAEETTRLRALYGNLLREPPEGWGSFLDLTWNMVCRRVGVGYVRYRDCLAAGAAAVDAGEAGLACRYGCRALLMRPWRVAGWGLLFRAVGVGIGRVVGMR